MTDLLDGYTPKPIDDYTPANWGGLEPDDEGEDVDAEAFIDNLPAVPENFGELILPMTPKEAREELALMHQDANSLRNRLLNFHRRAGYRAVGYKTFEALLEHEFGIKRTTGYKWIQAAKMEADLCTIVHKNDDRPFSLADGHARELAKLPTTELRAKAYNNACITAVAQQMTKKATPTANNIRDSVESILRQMKEQEQPAAQETASMPKKTHAATKPAPEQAVLTMDGDVKFPSQIAREEDSPDYETLTFQSIERCDSDYYMVYAVGLGMRCRILIPVEAMRR